MAYPITDDIDKTDRQMLLTVNDIRESDRARTISMINQSWLHRLFRHFPEIANLTIDITIDWPGRLPIRASCWASPQPSPHVGQPCISMT